MREYVTSSNINKERKITVDVSKAQTPQRIKAIETYYKVKDRDTGYIKDERTGTTDYGPYLNCTIGGRSVPMYLTEIYYTDTDINEVDLIKTALTKLENKYL